MFVTHVSEMYPTMPIEQQLEVISYGSFIEHCFLAASDGVKNPVALEAIGEQIRNVGVENVILSSDFGRTGILKPVEGFGMFLGKMLDIGFSRDEIRIMTCDNPKRLLDR
jgi:hypothetical protein